MGLAAFAKLGARCRVLASMPKMTRSWKSLFAQVRNRRVPDSDRARSVYAIGLVRKARARGAFFRWSARLQLLHKPFAEVSNSVMIRMLLGTMQGKVVESHVAGLSFELENTLVG